jgi:hypothetical protein
MPGVKAQSAMEYLMTYGWAILIIAVVLGVLFQLGVFSSSSFSVRVPPGACRVLRTSTAVNLVGQCSGILPQYVAQLNGASSYINNGNIATLDVGGNSFTLSVWAYIPNTGTTRIIAGKKASVGSDAGFVLGLWDTGTTMGGRFGDGSSAMYPVTAIIKNSWVNIATTWNSVSKTVILYVNGANTVQSSNALFGSLSNIASFQVGSSTYTTFDGKVTNVQLYNASLSAEEAQTLYLEGIGGAPVKLQNLVGWWPLNGNANDYSGNNNNGAQTAVSYATQYGK